jgi:hypothetical protein
MNDKIERAGDGDVVFVLKGAVSVCSVVWGGGNEVFAFVYAGGWEKGFGGG